LSSLAVIEFSVDDDCKRVVGASVSALSSAFGLWLASPAHEIAVTDDNQVIQRWN